MSGQLSGLSSRPPSMTKRRTCSLEKPWYGCSASVAISQRTTPKDLRREEKREASDRPCGNCRPRLASMSLPQALAVATEHVLDGTLGPRGRVEHLFASAATKVSRSVNAALLAELRRLKGTEFPRPLNMISHLNPGPAVCPAGQCLPNVL